MQKSTAGQVYSLSHREDWKRNIQKVRGFLLSLPPSLNSKIQGCARLCGAFRLRVKEAIFIDVAGFEPGASVEDWLDGGLRIR